MIGILKAIAGFGPENSCKYIGYAISFFLPDFLFFYPGPLREKLLVSSSGNQVQWGVFVAAESIVQSFWNGTVLFDGGLVLPVQKLDCN